MTRDEFTANILLAYIKQSKERAKPHYTMQTIGECKNLYIYLHMTSLFSEQLCDLLITNQIIFLY